MVKDSRGEIHIYSFYGDYILGNHSANYTLFEKNTDSLLVDVATTFKEANIARGSYTVAINFFKKVWGDFDHKKVFLADISPDRNELKLSVNPKYVGEFQEFLDTLQGFVEQDILNNLVINFGFNQIQKIINFRVEPGIIYVKLYQPLFDEIELKDQAWFDFELIDPYLDTVVLTAPIISGEVNYLRGPNFDIDTNLYQSNGTDFKNWNDLLDANLSTQQRIIEESLSGSINARLNVDYTSFENFVFYSSAEERIRNLHYKVSKIEEYSSSISILQSSTASNTIFVSQSVGLNQRRIDQITSNFTDFEKWIWYEPTRSIFTHDRSGSITPWPKRIFSGSYLNYPISSSQVDSWYNTLIVSSSEYDLENNNRLHWAVPEHIYMDPGNSDFVLFIDMVGEHFDVLYSYISALPQIHHKEEHPQRGVSGDLLPYIAKSFGWQVQNTRNVSDLWKYKLGTDSSGSFQNTGSLFTQTHESQTQQVWRRIVNNLPYLYKTKGTPRSIKALMSIYGIPQTLISIKEYGGPSKKSDIPVLIEDKFNYALNFTGSNYIELPRRVISTTSGSWGGTSRVPDTIEFRFRTEYSSSVSMSLWAIEQSGSRTRTNNLEVVHSSANNNGTQSYQGSRTYGYLRYSGTVLSASLYLSSSATTSAFLPLFDNDWWTVKISTSTPLSDTNKSGSSIDFKVEKVSDCLSGRIAFSQSFSWTPNFAGLKGDRAFLWGAETSSISNPHFIVLGGTTGSNINYFLSGSRSNRFVGQIQGYKEWFEVINGSTFDSHVQNPRAYNGNNPTSSYYTLFRYYPLGLDEQRWDHSVYQNVSSSHPNRRASFDTTASFKNFTGTQADQYDSFNETFYIQTPSLGGNLLRSEKIRLEENTLIRDLSPVNRSTKGAYDNAGFDSNRLAIVFAPSDHVNSEIYNHTGFDELDDYIGDPESEFQERYYDLDRFKGQYFQKYAQNNDVNALIEILAFYDYTFFEQIKQLVPGRADLIAGILIEPDILHRSKVQLTKRPVLTKPMYDTNISYAFSQSGQPLYYQGTLSSSIELEFRYDYLTGSINHLAEIDGILNNYLNTGSNSGTEATVSCVPHPYSGSQTVTQSYIDKQRLNCCYKKVIYHYSASGQFSSRYEQQWYAAVSKSYGWHYSRSLECTSYQYQESCAIENRKRFGGSKLEGPGINIDSPNTIDFGPVISIWYTDSNILKVGDSPLGGNLIVE